MNDRLNHVLQWEGKCGELDVSKANRPRRLNDENAKLKEPPADAMLDMAGVRREVEDSRLCPGGHFGKATDRPAALSVRRGRGSAMGHIA